MLILHFRNAVGH